MVTTVGEVEVYHYSATHTRVYLGEIIFSTN